MGLVPTIKEAGLLIWCPILLALDVVLTEKREYELLVDIFRQNSASDLAPLNRVFRRKMPVRRQAAVTLKDNKVAVTNEQRIDQSAVRTNVLD